MLNESLNMTVRDFTSGGPLQARPHQISGKRFGLHVHLPDAQAAADAAELIDRFGDFAADEAGARASRSRDLGNVIHYCRWRQIQRLIEKLGEGGGAATVH